MLHALILLPCLLLSAEAAYSFAARPAANAVTRANVHMQQRWAPGKLFNYGVDSSRRDSARQNYLPTQTSRYDRRDTTASRLTTTAQLALTAPSTSRFSPTQFRGTVTPTRQPFDQRRTSNGQRTSSDPRLSSSQRTSSASRYSSSAQRTSSPLSYSTSAQRTSSGQRFPRSSQQTSIRSLVQNSPKPEDQAWVTRTTPSGYNRGTGGRQQRYSPPLTTAGSPQARAGYAARSQPLPGRDQRYSPNYSPDSVARARAAARSSAAALTAQDRKSVV